MRLTGDAVDPKGGIMYSDGTVCIGCAKLAPTEPIGAGLAKRIAAWRDRSYGGPRGFLVYWARPARGPDREQKVLR